MLIGDGAMSVRCIDLRNRVKRFFSLAVKTASRLRILISGHFFYLMSFARPNFHSTSDCCWKGNCEVCTSAQSAKAACLDPLVGVRHHRNQKVDQHHRCHQHVEPEDKLKRSKITAGDQNREELRT